ncbi:hypothetical protein RDI58_014982 [Solanum bulbocastanum]|uniref:RNase H type-1 domain-containing protein n=1 Tax=Solanum bulbocastanum TaxID=147425 RepID=A0AAN8TK05_SOLBU
MAICKVKFSKSETISHQLVRYGKILRELLKDHMDAPKFKYYKGKSSYAYCLRDREGNLIFAQADEIPETTNVEAETVAIKEAIYHCTTRGFPRVTIKTDSLLLKNILEGNWEIPWNIRIIMEDTLTLMQYSTVNIEHIYREGNTLADYLAN